MLIDDIRLGESAELEFKRIPNEHPERWLKTVVAFANCKGGRIVFGVGDAREILGIEGDLYAMRDSIADRIADGCLPMPDVTIDIVNVDGHELLELSVAQGHARDNGDNKRDNGDNFLAMLSEEQRRIYQMVKENPRISIRKMAEMLGVQKNRLDRLLSALKAKGVIERKGGTRGIWRVVVQAEGE